MQLGVSNHLKKLFMRNIRTIYRKLEEEDRLQAETPRALSNFVEAVNDSSVTEHFFNTELQNACQMRLHELIKLDVNN